MTVCKGDMNHRKPKTAKIILGLNLGLYHSSLEPVERWLVGTGNSINSLYQSRPIEPWSRHLWTLWHHIYVLHKLPPDMSLFCFSNLAGRVISKDDRDLQRLLNGLLVISFFILEAGFASWGMFPVGMGLFLTVPGWVCATVAATGSSLVLVVGWSCWDITGVVCPVYFPSLACAAACTAASLFFFCRAAPDSLLNCGFGGGGSTFGSKGAVSVSEHPNSTPSMAPDLVLVDSIEPRTGLPSRVSSMRSSPEEPAWLLVASGWGIMELPFPRTFAPKSESTIGGTCSRELSFAGTFAP